MSNIEVIHEADTPETEQARGMPLVLKELLSLLLKIGAAVLALALLFSFVYGLYRNEDPGMGQAVQDGDLVLFYRLDRQYTLGDTLLVGLEGRQHVRRVVATAGDTVDITESGQLVVNGAIQQERRIQEPTHRYDNKIIFPLSVGENEVFVLGDARENATDSRVYGTVDKGDTLGKVIAILRRRNI